MPVQCLIRRLTRAQVEKAITDKSMQDRLVLQDYGGERLLVVANQSEGGDPEANVALQMIANADAAIIGEERAVREAAEAKAKIDAAEVASAAARARTI
jgi:hypothetical protein